MKKLITVVLFALSLTTIKISAAQERIYYNFTYGDGVYYDLDTGLVKSNERFAVTNRNRVRSDKIWIVGNNYHHIVWWGENNLYLGYHNSANASYQNDKYLGDVTLFVTPPEGARYFHLQVCKERDNLINFERDTPMGDTPVVDKNTIRFDSPYQVEVVYEDLDYGTAPGLLLKYGDAYYIEYTITKLQGDSLNDDDVGIFFWWPDGLDSEDVGVAYGPPNTDLSLAQGIDNALFQSLPIGDFARVAGTFIADLWEWEGGPGHGRMPLPQLWVYTTKSGARMEFGDVYILPADSYDAQIESIREDPVEVFERFRATQVYYEREAITPPEDTNLAERVEAWLDNNNLNNNFFKTLVAIVVIVAVVIGLALLKAPGVAIIFAVVLIFALGVMFGWIPMWLVIPIALLCLGLILIKLKAGGGGIDESD
jgi:hypothetical protein